MEISSVSDFNSFSCSNVTGILNKTYGFKTSVTSNQAYGIMVTFGLFCAIVAKLMGMLRFKIYREKANVDRTFDAGGQISMGLTASTIVCEWTWSSAFVHSSLAAAKYGISGIYWYATSSTIILFIFAILCIELKIRAPGAKTYLEVIRARFGKPAHITFCVYALLTNVIVVNLLLIDGGAVLSSLVDGMSKEFASTMILMIIGSSSLIGGVAATSYISYFSTIILMFGASFSLFLVYDNTAAHMEQLGSSQRIYRLVSCNKTMENGTHFSFRSEGGFRFGLLNIIGVLGTVLMDQAFWQRSVAAKPKQGAWGFLTAGIVWFSIPLAAATSFGMGYVALGTLHGNSLLNQTQEETGLIPAIVADQILGPSGEALIVFLITVAVSTTGCAEVLAIVSILIYDIYATYMKPYRDELNSVKCLLCDKEKNHINSGEACHCESMTCCIACEEDDREREISKNPLKPPFKCHIHGKYRTYNAHLEEYKNWAIVLITILILPMTILTNLWEVHPSWLFDFLGIIISSGIFPLCLSMWWTRLTGKGVVVGMLGGSFCGLLAWLIHSSVISGGLSTQNFMENTGTIEVMLSGNSVSILGGLIISVVVSCLTQPECDAYTVWRNTLAIDNPLTPWYELYVEELGVDETRQSVSRPPLYKMQQAFKKTRWSVIIGSVSLTIITLFVGPLILYSIDVFSITQFHNWVIVSHLWIISGTIFMIGFPIITEYLSVRKTLQQRNTVFTSIERLTDLN